MEYFKDCMNEEQLRARYRELCKKMHPDRNANNPNATADFQEMQQQYDERKAELNGDYTKARRGRERRERENRERENRERQERERMRVAMVVEQARQNRQKHFFQLKEGDYIYAKAVDYHQFNIRSMNGDDILKATIQNGVKPECVVMIELIVNCNSSDLLNANPGSLMPDGIYGGWETIQSADPASGVKKAKRVAKVVMFRSEQYCYFGNPQGDRFISDFYMSVDYSSMWSTHLDRIKARLDYEKLQAERLEAERRAKLLEEQRQIIDELAPKLISMSAAISSSEREAVAVNNIKTVLKSKFPGTTFKLASDRWTNSYSVRWEDGPAAHEVEPVVKLFSRYGLSPTPFQERYGRLFFSIHNRKMSAITKAKILQQLGQVSESFRSCDVLDDVVLDDMGWMMLHLMVGVDVNADGADVCPSTLNADGKHLVSVISAVSFIFCNTSYKKTVRRAKKAA